MGIDEAVKMIERHGLNLNMVLVEYMSGNKIPFENYIDRYQIRSKLPSDPQVQYCAVMKMVTYRSSLPMWMRKKAKRWLLERSFASWDDGDVLV